MSKEKIHIFDTTLRDGAQTQGVDFSIDDKLKIAKALDDLGVDYIEGGWPGANPTDTEFFQKKIKFNNSILTAFGMTKRAGRSAENDPGLSSIFCLISSSEIFDLLCLNCSHELLFSFSKPIKLHAETNISLSSVEPFWDFSNSL